MRSATPEGGANEPSHHRRSTQDAVLRFFGHHVTGPRPAGHCRDMTLRVGLLLLAAGCAACFSDPPAPQRISSESGSSTEGSSGSSGSSEEGSSSGEEPSTTATFGTSSSGGSSSGEPGLRCSEAFDDVSCSAASDPAFEQCSWYPTISHDSSCEAYATERGACMIEQSTDTCRGPEPTCSTAESWYYRVIDGAVEVIDATNLCYGLSEFTPCPSPDEGATESESIGSSTSVGTTASSSTDGSADTGATSVAESGGGGTGGGTTGDGPSRPEQIEAACACACDD